MYRGVNRKQGVHDILFDILPLHRIILRISYFILYIFARGRSKFTDKSSILW